MEGGKEYPQITQISQIGQIEEVRKKTRKRMGSREWGEDGMGSRE